MPNIRETYRDQAFLGDRIADQPKMDRINAIADGLDRALNPPLGTTSATTRDNLSRMIEGMARPGEWRCGKAQDLVAAEQDVNRPANQSLASERLDVLVNATHIALKYGANDGLRMALESGSVADLERMLPEPLKGIGERVRNVEITDPQIRAVLDDLDKKGRVLRMAGPAGKERLANNLQEALVKLSEIGALSPKGDEEIMRVSAYIGAEWTRETTPETKLAEPSYENGFQGIDRLSKERQLQIIRPYLEYIEDSQKDTRGDLEISRMSSTMESVKRRLDPEVALELDARLALQDCYIYLTRAGGWIVPPRDGADPEVPNMAAAAMRAKANGHALTRETVGFFLETEKQNDGSYLQKYGNGLPVACGWDWVQRANFSYREVILEMARQPDFISRHGGNPKQVQEYIGKHPGETQEKAREALALGWAMQRFREKVDDDGATQVDSNFFIDSNVERKHEVRNFLAKKIGTETTTTLPIATKALELAERLAEATLETAVFNDSSTGNNQLAEAIHLREYREARAEPGRNRGPAIHENIIEGIGTSWLRYITKGRSIDNNKPLFSKDIKIGDIPEGSYTYFIPVWVTAKIHPLREALMDLHPDPKKMFSSDTMASETVDYFNKGDPPEKREAVRLSDGRWVGVDRLDLPKYDKEYSEGLNTYSQNGRIYRISAAERGNYVVYDGKAYPVGTGIREDVDLIRGKSRHRVRAVDFGNGYAGELMNSKTGPKKLRVWWVAGVVQMGVLQDGLGWTFDDLIEFERLVTKVQLSEKAGSFITKEQWDFIMNLKMLNDEHGNPAFTAKQALRSLSADRRRRERLAGLSSFGGGGGKGGKRK